MRFFYLDASALAKRYAREVGSPLINHLFASVAPDRLYVFNIGFAEVVSLLVRKRNGGRLPAAAFSQALLDLGAEIVFSSLVHKVVADNALVTAALPLIETHSINSTDAVIVRAVLDLAAQLRPAGNDMVLATSDQRLLRAARAEGLLTFDPQTQPQADLDTLLGP